MMPSMLAALLVAVAAGSSVAPRGIIYILGDDWGWGDAGAYGAADYQTSGTRVLTPNIDKLASEGSLFTDFHQAQSFCAPSRTAFMSSRLPAELKVNSNWDVNPGGWASNEQAGLPYQLDANSPNVASVLQGAGVRTLHSGKWHLGGDNPPTMPPAPLPSQYGFDLTMTHASIVYTNTSLANAQNLVAGDPTDPFWSADVDAACIDTAVQFIKNATNAGKPFYVNLWLHMSHDTIDPHPDWYNTTYPFKETCLFPAKQAGETICPSQVFWGAQWYTDQRLGAFFQRLDDLGVYNDTLVIFSSDNGAQSRGFSTGTGAFDNAVGTQGPFRGNKASNYEGGHRVQFIARWPGQVPAGRVDHSFITGIDLFPTFVSLMGTKVPAGVTIDGLDISHILLGASNNVVARPKPVFWRADGGPPPCWQVSPALAARQDDMKLLMNPDGSRVELYNVSVYNLGDSFFESQNLAAEFPSVVKSLSEQVLAWHHKVGPDHPNKTDAQMSRFGCSRFQFPGV